VPDRLVLVLAVVWAAGFLALRTSGSLIPLALMVCALALAVAVHDSAVRRMLHLSPWRLLVGLGGAGVMIGVTYVLFPQAARLLPGLEQATADLYSLLRVKQLPVWAAVLLVCPTAAAEEILFRGRLFEGSGSAWRTYAVATGVYALVHVFSGSATLVGIALICGAFWGGLRIFSRSLVPSILAHAIWDLSVLIFHPLG
jgi:membrane protease YdiL (CAAX protease family)